MAAPFLKDYPLKNLNTFGMDVRASLFAPFTDVDTLVGLLEFCQQIHAKPLILGGGSNMLFTRDYDGVVLKDEIGGIEIVEDQGDEVLVKAGAGVVWHQLVMWCIDQGLGGIENLSLIPGTTGAAPIQNIGAYGVELKDVFHSLESRMIADGTSRIFDARSCSFGYRDSIFKREMKGTAVITSVTLRLSRKHQLNVSYGAITQELQKMGITNPDIRNVSDAVCNIRRSKLPDPAMIGNAGSFFKNPEVSSATHDTLKKEFPNMVSYPFGSQTFKLAAGWLIEQCGWKGKVVGKTGSHKDQALVLVNYGGATGVEVVRLSEDIRASVREKFGVEIEPEVNII
ncbi:MAG: UDP-N-acetylmuramate dehydrogenase [Bacteroidota bacterium]|jgi:UDP-N-acetylmuramate dehydrogenase